MVPPTAVQPGQFCVQFPAIPSKAFARIVDPFIDQSCGLKIRNTVRTAMYFFASLLALAIYLLPVGVVLSFSARRFPLRGFARVIDVPIALGADVIVTLLLAWLLPLWIAVWTSRALWLGVWVWHVWRTRPSPQSVLDSLRAFSRIVWPLLGITSLVFLLFASLSYGYVIWDRQWHIPLTSYLRGQKLPFDNVFLPHAPLRYHYLGDVFAAMLQVCSGNRITSALALSLCHDLFASLAAVTVFACLRAFKNSVQGGLLSILALCLPLAGPLSLFRTERPLTDPVSLHLCGNSYFCLLTLGYRPHTMAAVYFLVSATCALALRARSLDTERTETLAPHDTVMPMHLYASLLGSVAPLSLLDEASLGMYGLALGAVWLVVPTLFGARRWHGLVMLGGLLSVIVFMQLVFKGSLAPGGPVQKMELLAKARLPGVFQPSFPLSEGRGRWLFLADGFPLYATSMLAGYIAVRARTALAVTLASLHLVLSVLGLYMLVKLEVNKDPEESQRFVTAGLVIAPVVAAVLVAAVRGVLEGRVLLAIALFLPSLSSLAWYRSFMVETMVNDTRITPTGWGPLYTADCNKLTGSIRADGPGFRHVEPAIYWQYVSCQPTMLAGHKSKWPVAVDPSWEWEARVVAKADAAKHPIESIVCASSDAQGHDDLCTWAIANLKCTPTAPGSIVRDCVVPPGKRREIPGLE